MNIRSYSCCQTSTENFKDISSLSSILRLVGDESRLKILCILKQGEHCVCEIIKHLGLSQTLISHHLKDLKEACIVVDRKDNRWSHYSLTEEGKRIVNLIFQIEERRDK
ncbi:MAG: metalloregulator ArsR/SmtB family transcription factor [Patescibacteria group bacterium]|nr:metalloregulator ArsR/SmtB family transcription factor [Patescibacteria group bacterium]